MRKKIIILSVLVSVLFMLYVGSRSNVWYLTAGSKKYWELVFYKFEVAHKSYFGFNGNQPVVNYDSSSDQWIVPKLNIFFCLKLDGSYNQLQQIKWEPFRLYVVPNFETLHTHGRPGSDDKTYKEWETVGDSIFIGAMKFKIKELNHTFMICTKGEGKSLGTYHFKKSENQDWLVDKALER